MRPVPHYQPVARVSREGCFTKRKAPLLLASAVSAAVTKLPNYNVVSAKPLTILTSATRKNKLSEILTDTPHMSHVSQCAPGLPETYIQLICPWPKPCPESGATAAGVLGLVTTDTNGEGLPLHMRQLPKAYDPESPPPCPKAAAGPGPLLLSQPRLVTLRALRRHGRHPGSS
jgi:hypothetical protein